MTAHLALDLFSLSRYYFFVISSTIPEQKVVQKVLACVAETLAVPAPTVTPDKRFIEDLGGDGLDVVFASQDAAQACGVDFDRLRDLDGIESVQDLIDRIAEQIHAQGVR